MKQLLQSCLLILLAAAICAGAFWAVRYGPSFRKMDKKEYYALMMDSEDEVSETEPAVVMEDHVAGSSARIVDGFLYLPYEMVRDEITTRYFWDEENEVMLYTTATQTLQFAPDSES